MLFISVYYLLLFYFLFLKFVSRDKFCSPRIFRTKWFDSSWKEFFVVFHFSFLPFFIISDKAISIVPSMPELCWFSFMLLLYLTCKNVSRLLTDRLLTRNFGKSMFLNFFCCLIPPISSSFSAIHHILEWWNIKNFVAKY